MQTFGNIRWTGILFQYACLARERRIIVNGINSIKDIVNYAAEKYGSNPYLRYKSGKEIVNKSFVEVKSASDAFGAALNNAFDNVSHVAIIGGTSYEWITAFLGTVTSGNVVVPLDKESESIDDMMQRADVNVLVYDNAYKDKALAAAEKCPEIKLTISMQDEFDDFIKPFDGKAADVEIDCDKLCAILFTSGTTGKSKGVMLTNRNIADNATCMDSGEEPGNRVMSVLPIHHAFCFTCDVLLGMHDGMCLCINDSIMRVARNLKLFKPHIILAVPMIFASMLKSVQNAADQNPDIPKPDIAKAAFGGSLRTLYSGGAYLNPNIVTGFEEFGIQVLQGYGMSECSPRISGNTIFESKPDSLGKVVNNCEARIMDGEIQVRGTSVMMGYYKDEERTREAFTEDGWLRTGDLGRLDEDNFLFMTGRKKNLIILSNGENVSAEELENKFDGVDEVAEIVVYGKDDVITAEIYPNPDMSESETQAAIEKKIEEINAGIPMYKRINQTIFRDEPFEKTSSHKIKRPN